MAFTNLKKIYGQDRKRRINLPIRDWEVRNRRTAKTSNSNSLCCWTTDSWPINAMVCVFILKGSWRRSEHKHLPLWPSYTSFSVDLSSQIKIQFGTMRTANKKKENVCHRIWFPVLDLPRTALHRAWSQHQPEPFLSGQAIHVDKETSAPWGKRNEK